LVWRESSKAAVINLRDRVYTDSSLPKEPYVQSACIDAMVGVGVYIFIEDTNLVFWV
jgi:hypothetical protein